MATAAILLLVLDGGGATHPAAVLALWVLGGVALGLIGVARSRRAAARVETLA